MKVEKSERVDCRFETADVLLLGKFRGRSDIIPNLVENEFGCAVTVLKSMSALVEYLDVNETALRGNRKGPFGCIVADEVLPAETGRQLVENLEETFPEIPVLVVCGSEVTAGDALQAGASEIIPKDQLVEEPTLLLHRLERILVDQRRQARSETLEAGMATLSKVHDVTGDAADAPEEKIDQILRLGTNELGFSLGYATRIRDGTQEIIAATGDHEEIKRGETDSLEETYCRKTIADGESVIVGDALAEGWEDDPAFERFGLRAYVGGHVTMDDETIGTICFGDENSNQYWTDEPYEAVIEGLAQWVGDEFQRHQHERNLEFVNKLVESVGVGAVVYDRSGRHIYANQAYADLFGVDSEQLSGTAIWDVDSAIEVDQFDEIWSSLEPGETRRTETTHEFAGTTRQVETVITCAEIESGQYHFGTVSDISGRNERRKQLELLHNATRELMEAESEEEVAEVVASTLRDSLDFEQNVVRCVDENAKLVPIAATEELSSTVGSRPTYPLSEANPAARAYETGETKIVDDISELNDGYDRDGMESALYLN